MLVVILMMIMIVWGERYVYELYEVKLWVGDVVSIVINRLE